VRVGSAAEGSAGRVLPGRVLFSQVRGAGRLIWVSPTLPGFQGTNRLIKQVKRAACGFRNRDNYRRRVRLHCTRHNRRLSARNPTVPA
jgi:hypothetical protein